MAGNWFRLVGLIAVSSAVFGCEARKSNRECTAVLLSGKQHVARGALDEATADLEKSGSICSEDRRFYVERLRAQIEKARAEQTERLERSKKEERAAVSNPLIPFLRFIGEHRDSDDLGLKDVRCVERGQPDFGWCEARVKGPAAKSAPEEGFLVRYWRAEPRAFRFSLNAGVPIECQDLGDFRAVRTWKHDGAVRSHCELTGGPLKGLAALVTASGEESRVAVFSKEYSNHDAEHRRVVEREGR